MIKMEEEYKEIEGAIGCAFVGVCLAAVAIYIGYLIACKIVLLIHYL